jgi:hypothetical protein
MGIGDVMSKLKLVAAPRKNELISVVVSVDGQPTTFDIERGHAADFQKALKEFMAKWQMSKLPTYAFVNVDRMRNVSTVCVRPDKVWSFNGAGIASSLSNYTYMMTNTKGSYEQERVLREALLAAYPEGQAAVLNTLQTLTKISWTAK